MGRSHVHSTTGARHRRVCRNGGEAVRRCAGVQVKTQSTAIVDAFCRPARGRLCRPCWASRCAVAGSGRTADEDRATGGVGGVARAQSASPVNRAIWRSPRSRPSSPLPGPSYSGVVCKAGRGPRACRDRALPRRRGAGQA